jgi:hypothetical protein
VILAAQEAVGGKLSIGASWWEASPSVNMIPCLKNNKQKRAGSVALPSKCRALS